MKKQLLAMGTALLLTLAGVSASAEVPITFNPRLYEEGKKITAWDGVVALWTLIKYRFVN